MLVAGTRQMVVGYEVDDSSHEVRVAQPWLRGFSTAFDVGDDVRALYESSNPAKARIQLPTQRLPWQGAWLPVVAGMQVQAEIRQGERTVMEYLLSPLRRVVSEAGGDR